MADNKLLGAGSLYYGGNEISKAYMGNNLVWEKAGEAGPDYSEEYFGIEAIEYCDIIFEPYSSKTENGHSFEYFIFHDVQYHGRPPKEFLYQQFVDGNYEVFDPYSDHSLILSLYPGDAVYMVGNMDKGVSSSDNSISNIFTFSGKVNLSGNIMSLTYGLNRNTLKPIRPEDLPYQSFTRYQNRNMGEFGRIFKNQPVVDAGNLVLPSTILNNYTYWEMFYGCTYLTTPPKKLPALYVYLQTYGSMFDGCTSLTTAPVLSATTLGQNSYRNMFRNCTSLTTAPVLPATTLTSRCYYQMFYGCTSLNYIKAMFTSTPGSYTQDWVKGVSATGTFVKNTSATWNVTGTSGIPSGWTVQTASS